MIGTVRSRIRRRGIKCSCFGTPSVEVQPVVLVTSLCPHVRFNKNPSTGLSKVNVLLPLST